MHPRTWLAAALLVVGTPSIALADLPPWPPAPVVMAAIATEHTAGSRSPVEAAFTIRNTGSAPIRLRVERAAARTARTRVPLRIVGTRPSRSATLAPGASTELRVAVDAISVPVSADHTWTIELTIAVDGEDGRFVGYATGITVVRRVTLL